MKTSSIIRKLVAVAGSAALFLGFNAGMTFAATQSANATGTVIVPLTLTNPTDLAFGSFAVDSAGTLAIDTDGTLSPSATIHPVTSVHSAASFDLGGLANAGYAITLPASITLTRAGGGSITVDTFSLANTAGAIVGTTSAVPESGTDVLKVGATAHLGDSQTTGSYTGSLSVTVNYN